MVLPFGIPRERKPKNWEAQQLKAQGVQKAAMKRIVSSKLGKFAYEQKAEIKPWKPRLKPMKATKDQVINKPALFILRHDPSDKKVMYIEQDLMAKPISTEIDKKSGYSYRLQDDKNVVVRKYLAMVDEHTLVDIVNEFVTECNRVLYLYCDTR